MPLSEKQLIRLDGLLAQSDKYGLEVMDGWFSAAIAGPGGATYEDCLKVLEGHGTRPWASAEDEAEARRLLHDLWGDISSRIMLDPDAAGDLALPHFDLAFDLDTQTAPEHDGDCALAADWALGARFAISSWPENWDEWMSTDDAPFLLSLIALSAESQFAAPPEDEAAREPGSSFEDRLAFMYDIPFVLHDWYRRNRPNFGLPSLRSGEKVGRNDPCPCGSGKKSKKCCHR